LYECEGNTFFNWFYHFYPSGETIFDFGELNQIGKEIVYKSPFYPNGMYEWFPWDIMDEHKKFVMNMKIEEESRKRKMGEEINTSSKRMKK
jgi:hypothetical protein